MNHIHERIDQAIAAGDRDLADSLLALHEQSLNPRPIIKTNRLVSHFLSTGPDEDRADIVINMTLADYPPEHFEGYISAETISARAEERNLSDSRVDRLIEHLAGTFGS